METSNNMNGQGEHNPATGTSAPTTAASTASTAAVRQQELLQEELSPPRNTKPLQVCGTSNPLQAVLSHTLLLHPLKVCGSAITPPGLSQPLHGSFDLHFLSPGLHKIPTPPPNTTPGDIFGIYTQNFITGVCYLVSCAGPWYKEWHN